MSAADIEDLLARILRRAASEISALSNCRVIEVADTEFRFVMEYLGVPVTVTGQVDPAYVSFIVTGPRQVERLRSDHRMWVPERLVPDTARDLVATISRVARAGAGP